MIKRCIQCGNDFSTNLYIDGQRIRAKKRVRCWVCLPRSSDNVRSSGAKYAVGNEAVCSKCSATFTITDLDQPILCPCCIEDTARRPCVICKEDFVPSVKQENRNLAEVCSECIKKHNSLFMKKKCIDYLGGKCVRCGWDECIWGLEFHHVDEKKFTISKKYDVAWNTLKSELDKCELLCANCHRIEHFDKDPQVVNYISKIIYTIF